jgi:ferredoxin-NADP reductase
MAVQTFPLILRRIQMVSPNVRHMVFSREDEQPLAFIPGQFISIHFEHEGKLLRRSYSIATIPGQTTEIEIALSYFVDGVASQFLFGLELGHKVDASGPYGRLILREEHPKRYVLVATGTGVTPYRSMIPALKARLLAEPDLIVELLLGVQGREHALYAEDFLALAKEMPRFHFHIFYSRENLADPLAHEHSGYVQTSFATLNLDPATDIIYLCGNPLMIDNAVELLKETGFAIQQLRREKYVS